MSVADVIAEVTDRRDERFVGFTVDALVSRFGAGKLGRSILQR